MLGFQGSCAFDLHNATPLIYYRSRNVELTVHYMTSKE